MFFCWCLKQNIDQIVLHSKDNMLALMAIVVLIILLHIGEIQLQQTLSHEQTVKKKNPKKQLLMILLSLYEKCTKGD